jgi:hypothetical protein
MPCNMLAVGQGVVTVDPNILTEHPQAKEALASLALSALKTTYETFRPTNSARFVDEVMDHQFIYPRTDGCTEKGQGWMFYPDGWNDSGRPEWAFGPITIRLQEDGTIMYRAGDYRNSDRYPSRLSPDETAFFIAKMDELIPQLALAATQESLVQRVSSVATVISDQWLTDEVRVLTLEI